MTRKPNSLFSSVQKSNAQLEFLAEKTTKKLMNRSCCFTQSTYIGVKHVALKEFEFVSSLEVYSSQKLEEYPPSQGILC